jgi:hypothetical protein
MMLEHVEAVPYMAGQITVTVEEPVLSGKHREERETDEKCSGY